jgi:hypothetical protein
VPKDPTLLTEGELLVTLDVLTVHAAYCQLWIAPAGAAAWQDPREVASGGALPRTALYDVARKTLLGWRLSVASTVPSIDYRVTLTLTQGGTVIPDGVLLLEGTTDAGGQAVDTGYVTLR